MLDFSGDVILTSGDIIDDDVLRNDTDYNQLV